MIRRLALVLIAALWVATGSAVAAEGETVRLGIEALESEKPYFDITLEPGESEQLTVRFTNHGEAGATVAVYASDVYSIHGGGIGLRAIDEPQTGATTWLDFQPETMDLLPGEAVDQAFTVTVPDDADPGDYITSIVLQNANPVAVGSSDDAQRFTQTVRHGVAVAIDVPGTREPAFEIGAIVHEVVAGRSVVLVDIANEGNAHLKPGGQFTLFSGDDLLTEIPVGMDSVYAGSETKLEILFDHELEAGDYYASLSLEDEETGAGASVERIPITAGTAPDSSSENETPAGGSLLTRHVGNTGAGPSNIWLVLVGGLSGIAALAGIVFMRRRRNSEPPLVGATPEPATAPRHDVEPGAANIAGESSHVSRSADFSEARPRIRQLQPAKAMRSEYHVQM